MQIIDILRKNAIDGTEIECLKKFKSRDGFILINDQEFNKMENYFKEFPIYKNIVPILTDNNSNYVCLYIKNVMKGLVCYLSHDEINLEPKFRNISNLINTIEKHHDIYDFGEFDENIFDFPAKNDITNFAERKNIIDKLYAELSIEFNNERRQQIAFSIMVLTDIAEIEKNIYRFLEDEDMYVQERAIQLLGFHEYKPAREKLMELAENAMPNGQTAAKMALKKLRHKSK
jgi:hypothetical protein